MKNKLTSQYQSYNPRSWARYILNFLVWPHHLKLLVYYLAIISLTAAYLTCQSQSHKYWFISPQKRHNHQFISSVSVLQVTILSLSAPHKHNNLSIYQIEIGLTESSINQLFRGITIIGWPARLISVATIACKLHVCLTTQFGELVCIYVRVCTGM
jgi:hypothetical protein